MDPQEIQQIRDSYARRTRRYDPWVSWIYHTRQGLERGIIRSLNAAGMFPPARRSLLDVGCGAGANLLFFLQLGFEPACMRGIELLEDRVVRARSRLPADLRVDVADASTFAGSTGGFDIVFQSMLFSSVLDGDFRGRIASNMWRMVRPGGGVMWYDFTWDNPENADVQGVPVREIRRLFPAGEIRYRRVTLAPPLARAVCQLHSSLYGLFDVVPFLRTHVLAWIAKPAAATT
jgi:SAM-dependent methyltransferase